MEKMKRSVAILIFDQVELLDFAGPFEVFSSARATAGDQERLMQVFVVAETMAPVTCRAGLVVQPAYTLDDCPAVDILVVPGGYGTRSAVNRLQLINWIAERSQETELTTSVCTGSFLLAQAGLLAGKPATTHWASIERMRQAYPGLDVKEEVRWVEAGDIITGAGVSAGIDMSLHMLARLYGPECAAATAHDIEYDYWKM
jgi:transcriptional regulator GlxA family with amidase domain